MCPRYKSGIELQTKAQGDTHPDTLRALRQLALVLKRQGKFAEATTIFRDVSHLWSATRKLERPSAKPSL